MCNTSAVQELKLYRNEIGDAGVTALADACASGALAQLTVTPHRPLPSPSSLTGCTLLTQTCRSMCDPSTVQTLDLQFNQIGDAGVTALADACASGSLASITNIYLQNNKATQVGKEAMRDVAKARGFSVAV